jgi:RHS repeat-associated protein
VLRFACFLLVFSAVLSMPQAIAQAICSPSVTGEPCPQGGLATLASSEPALNMGAGNPIHIVTGNKYQRETDLPANPHAPGLEIVRHYNSSDPHVSATGPGWRLSYDTRLYFRAAHWQIIQADGSRIDFHPQRDQARHAAPASYAQALPNRHGSLRKHENFWIWAWPDGRLLRFDAAGYLVHIQFDPGQHINIYRHPSNHAIAHAIKAVANQRGQSLTFHYRLEQGRGYLDRIDTARGPFIYRHENVAETAVARLLQVVRPDGMQRHYLYEAQRQSGNRYALTGIVLRMPDTLQSQRINTWAYDLQGRAILAISGPPDSQRHRLTLHYDRALSATQPGTTTVTSGHEQQQTRFTTLSRHGQHRLVSVDGALCPGCTSPGSHASYDAQGRLVALNTLALKRDDKGVLREVHVPASGWPGLIMRYTNRGLRQDWQSTLTGREQISYDLYGRPVRRQFANGDHVLYSYDTKGRPITQIEQRAGVRQLTRLSWQGNNPVLIQHPHETETRNYDSQGRLIQRTAQRTAERAVSGLLYRERFEYDPQHRLSIHHLPEGGALLYHWGSGSRLLGIDWRDATGHTRRVIHSTPAHDGYEYGNDLRHRSRNDGKGNVRHMAVVSKTKTIWAATLNYDTRNRLAQEIYNLPDLSRRYRWRYAYDTGNRLIGADVHTADTATSQTLSRSPPTANDTRWYAWHNDGSLAAMRARQGLVKPQSVRDASGLPHRMGDFRLRYGPSRRLQTVHQNGERLARYYHNAFGQRIIKRRNGQETHYFYLNNQLVAQADRDTARPDHALPISRRYIYAHHVLVGFIDYESVAGSTRHLKHSKTSLHYVHGDAMGAPRVVTDHAQNIRWAADYTPAGLAYDIVGDLNLDIRLPGQIFDAETTWHDNLLRHYMPAFGHYLEPDPLGPTPSNQALGYAQQQPRRYIDPYGLLLFAFDGTRRNADTQSNVWTLSRLYQDGPVFYHSGPGTPLFLNWDAITAWRASQILDTQWQSLLNALYQAQNTAPSRTVPIDIIGFSRGAALARHFGNQVGQHLQGGRFTYSDASRGALDICVDLRFMGLFDTVAQFGLAGISNSNYDLSIASAWQWVAHAVALHEHRWMFPLASVSSQDNPNVVEAPFIGAHSDIGGGSLQDEREQVGDLADVSLNWMLWQARMASVPFDDLGSDHLAILAPIVNDARTPVMRQIMNGDRAIQDATGATRHSYQDDHPTLGRSRRTDVEALIDRNPDWQTRDEQAVGMVDMLGYGRWLKDELGWDEAPV